MELAIQVMRQSVSEPRKDGKASPLVGAALVKPDGAIETACRGELRHEIGDANALDITCSVNNVLYQDSNTSDMVFTISELVSYVSSVCEIRPGDIIFTGSPHGVGQGQHPPVFLKVGDVIDTAIEGLGSLCNVALA